MNKITALSFLAFFSFTQHLYSMEAQLEKQTYEDSLKKSIIQEVIATEVFARATEASNEETKPKKHNRKKKKTSQSKRRQNKQAKRAARDLILKNPGVKPASESEEEPAEFDESEASHQLPLLNDIVKKQKIVDPTKKLILEYLDLTRQLDESNEFYGSQTEEIRAQRENVYSKLNELTGDKKKTKELLMGLADDFTADEKLAKKTLKHGTPNWHRHYENSKLKTDYTEPAIKAKRTVAEAEYNRLNGQETEQEQQIKQLEEKLEATRKAKKEQFKQLQGYDAASAHCEVIKRFNEMVGKSRQDELIKRIAENTDIINNTTEELALIRPATSRNETAYQQEKKLLEDRKQKAKDQKNLDEEELAKIKFLLPKINEPGSKTRHAKETGAAIVGTVAAVASYYNPFSSWFGKSADEKAPETTDAKE